MRFKLAGAWRRSAAILAVTTLVVGTAVVPAAAAPAPADDPPSDRVVIEVVTVKGSGCRKTAEVAVSPDNEAFTVTYSAYLAQVGVGAKNKDSRQGCQLNLRLAIPRGYTYAISRADYQGFAFLENGASAVERAKYRLQGSPEKVFTEHPFAGPFDDNWHTTDITEPGSLIFGQCGKVRTLRIDTELEVRAGTSDPETTTSFISMDFTDGSISTYHFVWRTCR